MDTFANLKNILLFILLFAVLAGGYWFFLRNPDAGELLLTEEPAGATTEAGRELILLSAVIDGIQLDDSIFGSSAFQSLKDLGKDLVPEPIGRRNPFAPLGSQ